MGGAHYSPQNTTLPVPEGVEHHEPQHLELFLADAGAGGHQQHSLFPLTLALQGLLDSIVRNPPMLSRPCPPDLRQRRGLKDQAG